jgi:polyribonucleotide nucleotidyltransferase
MSNIQEVQGDLAGVNVTLKTGQFAFQADGAVTIEYGGNVIMAAAVMNSKPKEGMDFFPLLVDFEEKFYAAGKIKGSRFIKREGRPPEDAILTARMIDRPLRPMFPKYMRNDVVISVNVLSSDKTYHPGAAAITVASTALIIGGFPIEAPVSAVRIGLMNGEFLVNPTYEQVADGDLELLVAGTVDAITMVEAGAKEVDHETMLKALDMAHAEIKKLCALQEELQRKCGKEMRKEVKEDKPEAVVVDALRSEISDDELNELYKPSKPEVYDALNDLVEKYKQKYADKCESDAEDCEQWSDRSIAEAVDALFKENMRKNILDSGKRLDGRTPTDVRAIDVKVGVLPQPHGTGLFQRGETQVLSVATLAGPGAAQIVDSMDMDYEKRYFHHYNFPGFCVGEARGNRGTGRREIGHGFLAERALMAVLPSQEDFPYTMRVVSEVLACNGSSSMGSVCGSTLALMDAGVPISASVVGIAIGMVSDEESGKNVILSDIQGFEDFLGDMDFKYAATDKGITALQMDVKIKGLTLEMLGKAFEQAKAGRQVIADAMNAVIAEPRPELSPTAPMIKTMHIDPDDIRTVIGKGGETIQGMIKEFDVDIDINDDGLIFITAPNSEAGNAVEERIKLLTYRPSAGDELDGEVVRIMDFGAFVEIAGGKDGLIHISKLSKERVNKVEDVVKIGDRVKVKVNEIDSMGRINLSLIEKL